MQRSYRQNCLLAHALDQVGDRWTLLIARELLLGPRRYGELLSNLEGIGTNLLATRLRDMKNGGLLTRNNGEYQLSQAGLGLEQVVYALVRFGLRLDVAPSESRLSRPEWDGVALRALFRPERACGLAGVYVLALDDREFQLTVVDSRLMASLGGASSCRARVELSKETALRLATGELGERHAARLGLVHITGRRREGQRLLRCFSA